MEDQHGSGVLLLKVVRQAGNVYCRNLCSPCKQNFPMDEIHQGQEMESK